MMQRIFVTFCVLSLFLVFQGCRKTESGDKKPGDALIRVGDRVLTRGELEQVMPRGLSPEDSTLFARNYLKQWAGEVLLYNVASRNIPDMESIDKLVERYRRELIMFEYQKQLLNEKLSKEISEEEMKAYYEANKDKFKLRSGIIKGLFLKVADNSPEINKLKRWYRSEKPDAIENIEKYGLKNAVIYEYFYDKWVSFAEIMNNIPYPMTDETLFLRTHNNLEVKHNGYLYLLNISDYLPKGSVMPFDFAKAQIQEILINQRKMQFIKNIEEELYNEALKDKKIEIYRDSSSVK